MTADELRAPGTDDEPWDVPRPDPPARPRWARLLVLLVVAGAIAVLARQVRT